MDYFGEAENILKSYRFFKTALENIRSRRNARLMDGAPRDISALDYENGYKDKSQSNETINQCVDLIQLNYLEKSTEDEIEKIETILGQMPEAEADLLRMWYIDGLSKEEISERLDAYSRQTAYKRRNAAIVHFAILYFGAVAI